MNHLYWLAHCRNEYVQTVVVANFLRTIHLLSYLWKKCKEINYIANIGQVECRQAVGRQQVESRQAVGRWQHLRCPKATLATITKNVSFCPSWSAKNIYHSYFANICCTRSMYLHYTRSMYLYYTRSMYLHNTRIYLSNTRKIYKLNRFGVKLGLYQCFMSNCCRKRLPSQHFLSGI